MSKEVASVYLHIGNSGVTFSVVDEGWGPTVVVHSSTFGNNDITQKVHVTPEDLKVLSRMFEIASTKTYSKHYCHAATTSIVKPNYDYKDVWEEPKYEKCCAADCNSKYASDEDGDGDPPAGMPSDGGADFRVGLAEGYIDVTIDDSHGDISMFYSHQYVQCESHDFKGDSNTFFFNLSRKGYLPSSLVGRVFKGGDVIQKFSSDSDGTIRMSVYDKDYKFHSIGGGVNPEGNGFLIWSYPPGEMTISVDYEFDIEVDKQWRKKNG